MIKCHGSFHGLTPDSSLITTEEAKSFGFISSNMQGKMRFTKLVLFSDGKYKQTKKSEYLLTSKYVRSFVHRLVWKS